MARKKPPKLPVEPEDDDLEWLRESYTDALDHGAHVSHENAELRLENARLIEQIANLRKQIENQGKINSPERSAEPSVTSSTTQALSSSASTERTSAAERVLTPPSPISTSSFSQKIVQVAPPTRDRIAIYRALFRGREDVYAKRWENQAKGTKGYVPACAKEWQRPHCTKPQKKCTECLYSPMKDEVIAAHLTGVFGGRDFTAGVYPMLPDDTCWFLAADFDGDEWQSDAVAYLTTCRDFRLPAYLERSRSGNGGHIWIFFEAPILAGIARKLGTAILTKTMEMRHEIKFKTYDRFFPNQDTLPRGGFGNLIALPLNGRSARAGNSLFLDDDLQPFDDQWAMLQSVRRVANDHAQSLADAADRESAVISVRQSVTDDEQQDPWVQPPSRTNSDKKIPGMLPKAIKIVQRYSLRPPPLVKQSLVLG